MLLVSVLVMHIKPGRFVILVMGNSFDVSIVIFLK